MVFQDAPDTEAPVEMNTYFPQFKAFWASELVTGTIHNIYTLRGAAVRNALNWSKEINEALYKFGGEAEVMFASHSWPRWGNDRIQEVLRTQRDAYANLNNQTLHYVNQGVTINEIHNVYEVPKSLQQSWAARSYHGDVQNNVRGVVNRFLGHFDGNPANLIPLSPKDSAPLYVEMMGGSDEDHRQGQGADGAGQVPARHRDPQQAGVRRAAQPARAPAAGRRLRAARLPGREHQRAQHLPAGRVRAAQRACRAACRPARPGPTSCARCRPSSGSTSSASAWTRRRPRACSFTINLVHAGQWREVRRRAEQRDAHDASRASRRPSPT